MECDEKSVSEEELRLLERLLARMTTDENGCWVWRGARTGAGYGGIWVHGEVKYVHRLAAALFLALDEDSGLSVLHECDNPGCFNPSHLRLGTQADNMHDCAVRGRINRKLDEADVIGIKRLLREGHTHKSIGERYGVTKENVGQISRGKTWKHVPDPGEAKTRASDGNGDLLASASSGVAEFG